MNSPTPPYFQGGVPRRGGVVVFVFLTAPVKRHDPALIPTALVLRGEGESQRRRESPTYSHFPQLNFRSVIV